MSTKCVLLFQSGDQQAGWSEVYYNVASSIAQAKRAMDLMSVVRIQLLSPDNSIIGFRISNPVAPPLAPFVRGQRAAQLFPGNLPGSYPKLFGSSDLIFTSAMFRYNNLNGDIFKNQLLRGVPDSLWQFGTDNTARSFMTTFVPKWQDALANNGFVIRHYNRAAGVAVDVPIATVVFRNMTHRNTGRSFATLRGRR